MGGDIYPLLPQGLALIHHRPVIIGREKWLEFQTIRRGMAGEGRISQLLFSTLPASSQYAGSSAIQVNSSFEKG
jgi:hypothetical protein